MNKVNIMVDLETLGTGVNAPIIQIGACVFDLEFYYSHDGLRTPFVVGDTFDERCCPSLQSADIETIKWWLNTNPDLLSELLDNRNTELQMLLNFFEWATDLAAKPDNSDLYIWGNGAMFDNRLLFEKAHHYQIEYPFSYKNDRCFRTLKALAENKSIAVDMDVDKYVYIASGHRDEDDHNALVDAKRQAHAAAIYYRELMLDTSYEDRGDLDE